ncbi:MAG TPA: hypothetical protein PLT07_11015, partial [Trueperaceae bacterium]|nr:hypothetical protein [Trueperaceae bacterium]
TAYLKAHYPVEFAAALLTVERGDSDKVAQYVGDARHLDISVLAPDINASRGDFTPVDGVVRFGLYGIKNLGYRRRPPARRTRPRWQVQGPLRLLREG